MSFSKSIPAGNTSPRHIVGSDTPVTHCEKSQKWECGATKSTNNAFTIPPVRGVTDKKRAQMDRKNARERNAYSAARERDLLAFKGQTHNFTQSKTPSKTIHYSIGANRTI